MSAGAENPTPWRGLIAQTGPRRWLWREAAYADLFRLAAHELRTAAPAKTPEAMPAVAATPAATRAATPAAAATATSTATPAATAAATPKSDEAGAVPPAAPDKAVAATASKPAARPVAATVLKRFDYPLRVAVHIAFASLWVACPNWQRRADGFGSWVGVSVLSVEQERLSASFIKMFHRFLGNSSAGVFAMIVAQILNVNELIVAAGLVAGWIWIVLSFYEPTFDYAMKNAAYSSAIFLFGGLVVFNQDSVNLGYISLRITMVSADPRGR